MSQKNTNICSITGLIDRATFIEQSKQLLEFSNRTKAKASLLFFSIKPQDRHLEQQLLDLVLTNIGSRLLSIARKSDIYAYLGDMSFANLSIATSEHHEHALALVEKLKHEFSQPLQINDGATIPVSIQIGVAQFPEDGTHYEALISKAKATTL